MVLKQNKTIYSLFCYFKIGFCLFLYFSYFNWIFQLYIQIITINFKISSSSNKKIQDMVLKQNSTIRSWFSYFKIGSCFFFILVILFQFFIQFYFNIFYLFQWFFIYFKLIRYFSNFKYFSNLFIQFNQFFSFLYFSSFYYILKEQSDTWSNSKGSYFYRDQRAFLKILFIFQTRERTQCRSLLINGSNQRKSLFTTNQVEICE
ncbi:hypothetical protein ABPG74_018702 [Tetrahymena malaccensis]